MQRVLAFALGGLLATGSAHAVEVGQGKNIGLGLVLGQPSGITGKFYLSRQHALDVTLGSNTWDDGRDGDLWLSVVYLWHPSVLHSDPAFDLGWHFGIGGFVFERSRFNDSAAVGARAPIGLDFTLNEVPLQFFVDIAVDIELVPDPVDDLWLGAGLGGRYFF